VALIGGEPAPHYPPNKVSHALIWATRQLSARFSSLKVSPLALRTDGVQFILWDDSAGCELFKIDYNIRPVRACLTASRYAVVFERGVILYSLDPGSLANGSKSRIGVYETASNLHGHCCLGSRKLAFPGRTQGHVQVVDLETRKVSILPAHKEAVRAIAMSKDESIVATASVTGTLIRLWSTSQESRLYEVRRGLDKAVIFSLSFSPNGEYLAVTSDKSNIHLFTLPKLTNQDELQPKKPPPPSRTHSRTSSSPVTVPYSRKTISSASGSPSSPSSLGYGTSPPVQGKYRLGASPSDRTSITPSDASNRTGRTSPGWNDMALQQPQIMYGRPRPTSLSTVGIAPDIITDRDTAGYKPPQKWGSLANIPFAPRILKDTYSDMTFPFEIGDEPGRDMGSETTHVGPDGEIASPSVSGKLQREYIIWPGGRPPKGMLAWVDNEQFVVVGAGRDARWELFFVGIDELGRRGIGKRGWKRYMEDEGLD
jgi:hypothetical protein